MDNLAVFNQKEKQRRAASECRAYALENDLLSCLDTADHLAFHYTVIEEEQKSIPEAERSLAHEHLPQFHIPTTSITEDLPVPKHVANLIETACTLASADQYHAVDTIQPPKPRQKNTKIQPPLLLSGPEEDCAELKQKHQDIYRQAQDAVHQIRPIGDVDSLPQLTLELASALDEFIQTEAVPVSQDTVQFLRAFVASRVPKWEAELAECRKQLAFIKAPERRHMELPLRPTMLQPTSLADNDAFLFSEASDLSSHASEALLEAEQAIGAREESVAFSGAILDPNNIDIKLFEEESEAMKHVFSPRILPVDDDTCVPTHVQAISRSLELRDSLSILIADAFTENDVIQPSIEVVPDEIEVSGADIPANVVELETQEDLDFEQQTVEQMLGLGTNEEIAVLAKMPVPVVMAQSSIANWNCIPNSSTMFEQIKEYNKEAFSTEIWQPQGQDSHLRHIDLDHLVEAAAKGWTDSTDENVDVDEKLIKRVSSIAEAALQESGHQDIQMKGFQLTTTCGELVLRALPPEVFQRLDPEEQQEEDVWSSMMSQWKKKKQKMGHLSSTQQTNANHISPPVQGPAKFTAPELILGINAFAYPPSLQPEPRSPRGTQASQPGEGLLDCENPDETPVAPCPDIDPTAVLPKVILSTTLNHLIRSTLLGMLPNLMFIERDYQEDNSSNPRTQNMEADIIHSPRSGIIFMTMVGLRQSEPGGPKAVTPFQKRVADLATKYPELLVVIYRHNRIMNADLPELSPSDAMAFAELQGFARHLAPRKRVYVLYASGGERGAAWLAVRRLCLAKPEQKDEECLTEAATAIEVSLRRLGLNVYNSQIVQSRLRRNRQ